MSKFILNVQEDSDDTSADSDETLESGDDTDRAVPSRTKRAIAWCGVEDDQGASSASISSTYDNVRVSSFEKAVKLQLFSRSRYFLAIYPDGKVRGTQDPNDLHTFLEMINTGYPGHVVIRGTLTNLYLSMTKKGRLRAQGNRNADTAVFIEGVIGFYMYYLSRQFAHKGWYVGIKKSGKFKNASKTRLHQKAVHFVKRYR